MQHSWVVLLLYCMAGQFFPSGSAHAQLSDQDLEQFREQVNGQGSLESTRITKAGRFYGCELQFSYGLRDWRVKRGELVKYKGSIASYYVKGRAFNIVAKVRAADIRLRRDGQIDASSFDPADVSVTMGKQTLTSDKANARFRCDPDGLCTSFSSGAVQFYSSIVESVADGTFVLNISPVQGSMDSHFNPADLTKDRSGADEYGKFLECLGELGQHFVDQD